MIDINLSPVVLLPYYDDESTQTFPGIINLHSPQNLHKLLEALALWLFTFMQKYCRRGVQLLAVMLNCKATVAS